MSPSAERALILWPLLSSQLLLFGTTVFTLAVAPPSTDDRRELGKAFTPIWRALALIILLTSLLGLVAAISEMAELPLRGAVSFDLASEIVRETHIGRMWAMRIALALSVTVFAFFSHRAFSTLAISAITTAILLLGSLSSHAIDDGYSAVAVYFVHQMTAGLWIGVVSGLWLGFTRTDLGYPWVARVARRVSRIAAYSVGALILTGAYNAYEGVGLMFDHLFYSAYGRTLLLKIGLFAIVAAIGGYNRFILMPAIGERSPQDLLVRNVLMETVLLIGVLGVTALLSNTPPAHHP